MYRPCALIPDASSVVVVPVSSKGGIKRSAEWGHLAGSGHCILCMAAVNTETVGGGEAESGSMWLNVTGGWHPVYGSAECRLQGAHGWMRLNIAGGEIIMALCTVKA